MEVHNSIFLKGCYYWNFRIWLVFLLVPQLFLLCILLWLIIRM